MLDMKMVREFAIKWFDKFRKYETDYEEILENLGNDCSKVGFQMDTNNLFFEKYGNAAYDYEDLNKIIDDVTDVALLGRAIYSRWNYFNYLTRKPKEIIEVANRVWFMLAIGRLIVISGENPFIFSGTLNKINITTNILSYGPCPNDGAEIEQHLTITSDGCIWFAAYNYSGDMNEYDKGRRINLTIKKENVDKLFQAVTKCFSEDFNEIIGTDVGHWYMELTNTSGKVYKFNGMLCRDFNYKGKDLSDIFRELIGIDGLFIFDGNDKPNIINSIVIDYNRVNKININDSSNIIPQIVWHYTEKLIIDRKTGSIEYIQNIGSGCKVSHKYEIEYGVEGLLDDLDTSDLFSNVKGNPTDVIDNIDDSRTYKITVYYENNVEHVIEGSFDKYGLPADFKDFIETVKDFLSIYEFGDIFNESFYNKVKRSKSDYIFLSVRFNNGYKRYYYLTNDDSIKIGDLVVVPVGKDNHDNVVEVEDIEYFNEHNLPRPLENTKYIIGKLDSSDILDEEDEILED